jgi:CRISPR/Cas system CSM-associated protein Csm2 small subunit
MKYKSALLIANMREKEIEKEEQEWARRKAKRAKKLVLQNAILLEKFRQAKLVQTDTLTKMYPETLCLTLRESDKENIEKIVGPLMRCDTFDKLYYSESYKGFSVFLLPD